MRLYVNLYFRLSSVVCRSVERCSPSPLLRRAFSFRSSLALSFGATFLDVAMLFLVTLVSRLPIFLYRVVRSDLLSRHTRVRL